MENPELGFPHIPDHHAIPTITAEKNLVRKSWIHGFI